MPGKACLQLPLVLLFSFEILELDFVGNKGRPRGTYCLLEDYWAA